MRDTADVHLPARRTLVTAAALALTAAPTAADAAPEGAPATLRTARPADHAARPAALTEWWRLRAVDRRSSASVELRIVRDSNLVGGSLIATDATGRVRRGHVGAGRLSAGPRRLDGSSPAGTVAVRLRRNTVRATVAGVEATGTIRLRRARRGPAALGWRLGRERRTLNWAVPVATAIARGSVTMLDGARLDVRGWRASYEHGWGTLELSEPGWDRWDQYVLHGRRPGTAWLLHGLNRTDTITGPGARDGQWLGVLARVGPNGVRMCRARVRRSGWLSDGAALWPTRVRASCDGLRLRVRDRRGAHDDYIPYREIRVRARGRRGLVGLGAHIVRKR